MLLSLVLGGGDHIVDLEDHLHDLGGELELVALGLRRLEDALLVHVSGALAESVHTNEGVALGDLFLLDLGYVLDGVVAGVLGESERDLLEGVGEGADGVLLNAFDLVGFLLNSNGAGKLSGTTATDDVGVLDHVSHDADGIMEAALGLVANCHGSTANQDGDGLGIGAIFDKDDLIVGGAEGDLLYLTSLTKLLGGNFLEAGDDTSTGSESEELDLNTTDPADGGKFVMHEEVIGLVVETPLAEDDVGARVLAALDHIGKVVLLHLVELLVVLSRLDLETVLGLGLGGLEGAGEDENLSIVNFLDHLRVREVLVNDDTGNEGGVFEGATSLGNDLDVVEVNIATLEIGD